MEDESEQSEKFISKNNNLHNSAKFSNNAIDIGLNGKSYDLKDVNTKKSLQSQNLKRWILILSLLCLLLFSLLIIGYITCIRSYSSKSNNSQYSHLQSDDHSSTLYKNVTTTASKNISINNQIIKNDSNHLELTDITYAQYNNSRLPLNLIPELYLINLKIDVHNKMFYGNCTIFLNCTKQTSFIIVHSDSNLIFNSEFYLPQVHEYDQSFNLLREIQVKYMKVNSFYQYLIIEIKDGYTFKENFLYSVRFSDFYSEITNNLKGIYYSTYTNKKGELK